MLEDEESYLVDKAHHEGMPFVEAEARRLGKSLLPEIPLTGVALRQRPMLEMYRLLTGFEETNPNAVRHHIVELYGPPCPQCHKPLRTLKARFCAACGFGQAAIATDSRPLALRKPELFE
ncbi:hypothetical protein GCM10027422_08240 [Hymenobacter arcticus]